MITNNYVSLREWFYPIGNTPAVNLLRDTVPYSTLSKEQQNLEILLLACGDPRNILFSLYSHDALSTTCIFNFTCCDYEPAVLARNIILFTFIADQPYAGDSEEYAPSSTLWNIFYHVFISRSDLSYLQKQSRKLMELAISADSWSSSTYGKWIHFLDEDTRSRVCSIWSRYAETERFTKAEEQKFEIRSRKGFAKIYDTKIQNTEIILHGVRSAGPHTANAIETVSAAFRQYWETGVVGGNRKDVLALGDRKGRVNPMFAISSASNGDFAVHYGSDPLLGFHLAEAFDEAPAESEAIEKVVIVAKSEFRKWYIAFSKCLEKACVRLTIYYGEAIRLCYGLQGHIDGMEKLPNAMRLYKNVWSSVPLQVRTVDKTRQILLFDIIDTSNLVDHVGILNVLPAVTPLLRRRPSSVLYTESLLVAAEDPALSLRGMLCSDVNTTALILGLAPVGNLTGISTDSYATDMLLSSVTTTSSRRQFRMRIPWKVPGLGDMEVIQGTKFSWSQHYQVSMEAHQLAQYFFKVYLQMFEYEDWSRSFASIRRQLISPIAADLRYYTRLSLVKLLYIAKTNIITDWLTCMDLLMRKIESDKTIPIGSNSVQELYLHMHMFGLWEHKTLTLPPRDLYRPPYGMFVPKTSETGLLGQLDVPSAIFVALVVPRSKLGLFTDGTPESIGTPSLHLSIHHRMTYQNSFHAIQCFFGRLHPRDNNSGMCNVEEDNTGWNGPSDLVVTCQVPLYTLLLGPRQNVRVGLVVNTAPSTIQFTMKLGLSHTVFEAGLSDERRVWLLKEAPITLSSLDQPHKIPEVLAIPSTKIPRTNVGLDAHFQASDIRIHTEFASDTLESKSLKQGANIIVLPSTACTLLLVIRGCPALRLTYQYPIIGGNARVKVARKSSWIEVTVPVASSLTDSGYKINPFPVVWDGSANISWVLPRISLVQQPLINVSGKLDWVHTFISLALSDRERDLNKLTGQDREPTALLELKESLHLMFISTVGQHPSRGRVGNFQLVEKDSKNCDTIILASALRHDYDAGSVVLDAYAIPLTESRISRMSSSLQAFVNSGPLSISLSRQEEVLWKMFLPAAAERCRTWTHKSSCEYNIQGGIPLSTEHGNNPLCSCGEGKMSESFPKPAKYSTFRESATRVAIPVLFAVPYVESVMSNALRDPDVVNTSLTTSTHPANVETITSSREGMAECNHCGAIKAELKACVRCGKVHYCNHQCQKADWKTHKKVCGKN